MGSRSNKSNSVEIDPLSGVLSGHDVTYHGPRAGAIATLALPFCREN
jgi:hypothetical protein